MSAIAVITKIKMRQILHCLCVLLLSGVCLAQQTQTEEDHCLTGKHTILRDFYRSTGYDLRPTDTPHCDNNLKRAWYKFVDFRGAAITMPTSCPTIQNTCGTSIPIWLNGTVPKQDKIVPLPLCKKTTTSCCGATDMTFVKYCGDFILYYLFPTDGCDEGYCAGNAQRCPVNQWSKTEFFPCKDRFPVLKTAPRLDGPVVHTDQTAEFRCIIQYDGNDPEQRFEVSWTFDGRADPNVQTEILAGANKVAIIRGDRLTSRLDKEVGCVVKTYFDGREFDKSPILNSSNTVFFGIKDAPQVIGPNVRNTKTFDFQCQVAFPFADVDQQIEVVWTFDGTQDPAIRPQILTGQGRTATLSGADLKGHVNQNIKCGARLLYSNGIKSKISESKSFFFGITVSPDSIVINESDKGKTVTLTSTIPVVCDQDQECCVALKNNIDKHGVVYIKDSCEQKLCSSHWDANTQSSSITVTLIPYIDDLVGGTRNAVLTFGTRISSGSGRFIDIYQGIKLPRVTILLNKEASFSCSLTGDPHVTGFDYKYSYHFYNIGQFTAYLVKDRDFEVQIETWKCWSVSCVCGVIIREKNDIIRIYGCDKPNLFLTKVTVPCKLSAGTKVLRSNNGNQIGVILPSGSDIKIDITHHFLNLYIRTPAADKAKAIGICGTNDGNPNNDFTRRDGFPEKPCATPGSCVVSTFAEGWRVFGASSMFVTVPQQQKLAPTPQNCQCVQSTVCSATQHNGYTNMVCQGCRDITNTLTPTHSTTHCIGGPPLARKRRDLPAPADVSRSNDFKLLDVELLVSDRRANMSEVEARDLCNKTIQNAQLYSECGETGNVFKNTVDDCIQDIMVGGTTETMKGLMSAYTRSCQLALVKDEKNYKMGGDGMPVMKPVFMDFVCPVECLDHGKCVEGKCRCNEGWEGDVCQIDKEKGPQITRSSNSTFCYAEKKSCDSIEVDVTNVQMFDKLHCRVYSLTELDAKNDNPVITEAIHEGSPSAVCPLPLLGTSTENFTVSVTKDKIKFSQELVIRTFDSTCLNCDESGCVEKDNACHIDNVCYQNGEINKINHRLICDANRDTRAWSNRPSSAGTIRTALWVTVIMVGASVLVTAK